MSAATWQYDAWHATAYDVNAEKMRDAFREQLVCTSSGAPELRRLKLSDAIGHVHPDSERVVFNAFKIWLDKCLEVEAPPPPPPDEPLPPPAPEVEEPWVATWQPKEQCYGFCPKDECLMGSNRSA